MNETMMQMQQMQHGGAGIGVGMAVVYIAIYVFCAYCLARIAVKMGMPMGSSFIWAIIPIANVFLILKLSTKPMWWFILMLIPIVNIVISILVWMAIAERLGKPGWWGVMIGIVPIANIVFFLMLAFGETKTVAPGATA